MLGQASLRLTRTAGPAIWMRGMKSKKTSNTQPVYMRGKEWVPTRVVKVEDPDAVTWSTGEVIHPRQKDCPLGDKKQYPYDLPDGGRQYFGFEYYPRYPGEVDPPYEPAPLHLVTRVKSLKKKPWWDKEVMKRLGLDGKRSDYAIVKNNPENNAYLWKVKYLVKITPIQVPKDLPEDFDPACLFLKETGEVIYSPHVKVEDNLLEEDPEIAAKRYDNEFISKHLRANWENALNTKLC